MPEEPIHNTVNNIHPVISVDSNAELIFASESFYELLGNFENRHQQINGFLKPLQDQFSNSDDDCFNSIISSDGDRTKNIQWHKNGSQGWIGVLASLQTSDPQDVVGNIDPLTQVGNRLYFSKSFSIAQIQSQQSASRFIVMALDLDHFKRVNDTLGHAVGDSLLLKTIARIKRVLRDTDSLSRIGGDEFAIILSEADNIEVSSKIAERIIDVVNRPFIISGNQINIGVSIGIARPNNFKESAEEVLQRADIALYHSKDTGRSCYHWYEDEMSTQLNARRTLELDLRKALLLGQFKISYQPQLNLVNSKVHAFKSHIHWHHPQQGIIDSNDFMLVADEIGEAIEISKWHLANACYEAANWLTDSPLIMPLDTVLFGAEDFITYLKNLLKESHISPSRIELEINENILLRNESIAAQRMLDLADLGVNVSLSDFGKGLVSMSLLRALPISSLKFNSFNLNDNSGNEAKSDLMALIADIGTELGLPIFAEGTNSSHEIDELRQKIVSLAGIKLFKPLTSKEIPDFLRSVGN